MVTKRRRLQPTKFQRRHAQSRQQWPLPEAGKPRPQDTELEYHYATNHPRTGNQIGLSPREWPGAPSGGMRKKIPKIAHQQEKEMFRNVGRDPPPLMTHMQWPTHIKQWPRKENLWGPTFHATPVRTDGERGPKAHVHPNDRNYSHKILDARCNAPQPLTRGKTTFGFDPPPYTG